MPSKIPPTIADYAILPIAVPPTTAYPVQAVHHIYLRPHAPKIPNPDDPRSLFLMNLPIDSTSSHLRAIFITLVGAGRFESITFERERRSIGSEISTAVTVIEKGNGGKKRKRGDATGTIGGGGDLPQIWDRDLHRSGSTAVVIMADTKGVEAVLKAVKKLHKSNDYPVWGQTIDGSRVEAPALGSKRYLTNHELRYPSKSAIQDSVNKFMINFNTREEAAANAAKKARNVPDEDGFVTVTRGGRTGPARREEAEEARRKELEKEEEKRKSMGDFYRFQGRERRKEEQGELVRRFEEDRRRVESMREMKKGKFRPE
jgi:ribosomal RNA-processing protein 7